jgi:hypothetical protein
MAMFLNYLKIQDLNSTYLEQRELPFKKYSKVQQNELNSLIITACLEAMHGLVFFFMQR